MLWRGSNSMPSKGRGDGKLTWSWRRTFRENKAARAQQERVDRNPRVQKSEGTITGNAKERWFSFLDLCRRDLAELDSVDFRQPFDPAAGAIIEFCRVTRKTKKATIFLKIKRSWLVCLPS
jgi:hypothetical protein